MNFLAIDIGTSFTKGAVVDLDSCVIHSVSRHAAPNRLSAHNILHHELDPECAVDSARYVIAKLLKSHADCSGILICGQMGGLVLSDHNGSALRPAISWLDNRTTEKSDSGTSSHFEDLAKILGPRRQSVFGNEFRPGLSLPLLYHLNQTGELGKFENAIPVTLPDFVAASLCKVSPVIEWTGTTGMLDVTTQSYPLELFEELKLPQLSWPAIVDFRHCVGEYKCGSRSLPVYAATGDHQCSLAGTLLSLDELSINISTGSQVSMLTSQATADDYQLRPYFDGAMLRTVTNIPAGRALNAIVQLLTEMSHENSTSIDAWNYFFDQAQKTPESDVDVNLGLFPGAVQGPGHLLNLTENNLTVGHIARAALEQMATYYRQQAQRLNPTTSWSRLAFSGGIAQTSELLRSLIEQRFGVASRTAQTSEDAIFGMIVLGRVIAGREETVAEASEGIRRKFA